MNASVKGKVMWRSPPHASRNDTSRLFAGLRTVVCLGSLVFLAQLGQTSASRPTQAEGKQQGSLSVSLSARAGGRLEPEANSTQHSATSGDAVFEPEPLPSAVTGEQVAARVKWQEEVVASAANDPSIHCNDDVVIVCQVNVAMSVKRFMSFSDQDESFTIDFVYTLDWVDKRVAKVIPAGLPFITMDKDEVKQRIWIPDVRVTNRALEGDDDLFWEVKVNRDGRCMLVRRVIATISNSIDFTAYPFDRFHLQVELGSPKTFLGEMVLTVAPALLDRSTQAVKPEVFELSRFVFQDWDLQQLNLVNPAFEKKNGSLDMGFSRIRLTMKVDRYWWKVFEVTMVPELVMVAIVWMVTFYPRLPHFTMAKAVSLMVALLTLMGSRNGTSGKLPQGRSGTCWLEGFEDVLMFLTGLMLCMNVFMEIVYHKWEQPELAERMSTTAKWAFPCLCTLIGVTSWCFIGKTEADWCYWLPSSPIAQMATINKVWIGCFFFMFWHHFNNESLIIVAHASRKCVADGDLPTIPENPEDAKGKDDQDYDNF